RFGPRGNLSIVGRQRRLDARRREAFRQRAAVRSPSRVVESLKRRPIAEHPINDARVTGEQVERRRRLPRIAVRPQRRGSQSINDDANGAANRHVNNVAAFGTADDDRRPLLAHGGATSPTASRATPIVETPTHRVSSAWPGVLARSTGG